MTNTKIIKNIKEHFKNRESFLRDELYNFYKQFDPELNERTFGWRIFDLKKKNIINSVAKGIYTLSTKQIFKPQIDDKLLKINKILTTDFHDIKYCLWDTSWLHEFMIHQPVQKDFIVEAEAEIAESVFYKLKDNGIKDIFFAPHKNGINVYLMENMENVFIKIMLSRSPIQKIKKIKIAPLEKILVDIFTEEKFFGAYQGRELINIFENAVKKYIINFSKMFNYARRKRREKELKEFTAKHFPQLLKEYLQ
ncbi:MAG: hypothetical protein A2068_13100 [Ignavibacteria bacterium GWB2_35_6b]|nr:MAG: hypothetical protein A2068_13100 [Ignavibacteria bacterium GWB2_35_6b]